MVNHLSTGCFYQKTQDAVDLSRLALVPYRPATFPSLAPALAAPALAEKPKKTLDPGLCGEAAPSCDVAMVGC